ncbi:MAG: hypothetical protein ACMXYF_04740, partial [Candidatus Woesearchaeota archaeon]
LSKPLPIIEVVDEDVARTNQRLLENQDKIHAQMGLSSLFSREKDFEEQNGVSYGDSNVLLMFPCVPPFESLPRTGTDDPW